jgi:aspartyl-tRNA(Asn)/glutamyl-tRNA(Gln) amidotransferase subunit C
MAISTKEIEKVALLARLELNSEEIESLASDMSSILDYVETLSQVDTEELEDVNSSENSSNVFRDDLPKKSLAREEALRNSPRHNDEFFLAPKVIG